MITEKISALKIHKLKQEQYERELEAGNIDDTAFYFTEEVDYPVEVGTSGIWTYRKMASGIAECWGKFAITNASCNTKWETMYESQAISLPNFPFAFAEEPMPCLTWGSGGTSAFIQCVHSITGTNAGKTILARPSSSNNVNGYISMRYIGRWK